MLEYTKLKNKAYSFFIYFAVKKTWLHWFAGDFLKGGARVRFYAQQNRSQFAVLSRHTVSFVVRVRQGGRLLQNGITNQAQRPFAVEQAGRHVRQQ